MKNMRLRRALVILAYLCAFFGFAVLLYLAHTGFMCLHYHGDSFGWVRG